MTDSHCHIAGEEFIADLPAVVERARGAGVSRALVILAGVLLLFTEKPQERVYREAQGAGNQPIVIEQGDSPSGKKELRMKVKNWKDRWDEHPNEYIFYHVGLAFNNIARSILYIFGIEKDEK